MKAEKIVAQAMFGLLWVAAAFFLVATSFVWAPAWAIGALAARKAGEA